jgi:general secretion pathway protein H
MLPISAIGKRQRRDGFTLIELLVVITILGLMSGAVVLVASGANRSLIDEAETFGAQLTRARDEAILTNRTVEVRVSQSGYAFDMRRGTQRTALQAPSFAPREWSDETVATENISGRETRIAFDPTGMATPSVVELSREDGSARISVDMSGRVRIDARTR